MTETYALRKPFQLPHLTRLFRHYGNMTLSHTDEALPSGTAVVLVERASMNYDHRTQLAYAIDLKKTRWWILANEAGIPLDS